VLQVLPYTTTHTPLHKVPVLHATIQQIRSTYEVLRATYYNQLNHRTSAVFRVPMHWPPASLKKHADTHHKFPDNFHVGHRPQLVLDQKLVPMEVQPSSTRDTCHRIPP